MFEVHLGTAAEEDNVRIRRDVNNPTVVSNKTDVNARMTTSNIASPTTAATATTTNEPESSSSLSTTMKTLVDEVGVC